ncbi:MAG: bifunctional adenosylcobinamide kinase/adenosylcobinamide-phosphate guanylyltransferase [Chloroflexi bacterium]|nr:bifunctional adenosylcobinamide kinase/adenosylcobinamide-phosphate guanylyltransferase [Chloroflexota bacterium]
MSRRCILITGGSRSGKSAFAQKLAKGLAGGVLFVATAEAGDEEMAERIASHRKNRPKSWRTLEASRNIGDRIVKEAGEARAIVVDCLTLLISNRITTAGDADNPDRAGAHRQVTREINGLLKCLDRVDATFIIVSNEVGLGLVPPNPLGRLYRDLLGEANQAIAKRAGEVYMMAAGIPVRIK